MESAAHYSWAESAKAGSLGVYVVLRGAERAFQGR